MKQQANINLCSGIQDRFTVGSDEVPNPST